MTIEEFIERRIAEDEQIAKTVGGGAWQVTKVPYEGIQVWGPAEEYPLGCPDGQTVHIARHDPARVLREVAAKRRALEAFRDNPSALDVSGMMRHIALREFVIKPMAAIWSDHPDYQQEWASCAI